MIKILSTLKKINKTMSTQATIFLTDDNEHCYQETNEYDGDEFRIYLEINEKNITYVKHDEYGLVIGIKGDSQIAKEIAPLRFKNPNKNYEK